MIEINFHPSRNELRVFAGLQLAFFAIVAWIINSRFGAPMTATVLVSVSAVLALVGLVLPQLLRPVYIVWMVAVFPIGWAVSHLLLAMVFYLLITPVGLLMRLCGHDPMDRKFDGQATSYWKRRSQENETQRYFRQF